MDKGERGKRSSPSSAARRTYGLFSNIINLSSSSGVRSGSSRESPVDSCTVNPKLSSNVSVSSTKKKKKTRGNQSPYSSSSISSTAVGGMNVPGAPIGPAPRTFSILTALNELAISDQGTHKVKSPVLHHPPSASSISSGNSTSTNSSTATFQHSFHEEAVKHGEKIVRDCWAKGNSISGQKSRESESRVSRNERSKSKERTPEWIWKLFQLAKHGRLLELQQSLKGLDSTLIRHLADGDGNTLLHCASRGGHLSTLQWLVSILGQHKEAAVNDRNRTGRSVILTALKESQLKCFQWLVLNTKTGDTALMPNDGERSLLHYGASFGDLAAVRWLAHLLHDRGLQVDIKDSSGRTPLHMSAKAGYVNVCHELILAGADPLCQTELGWRPADLAIRHRRLECVNYFMMAETAASLGNELHLVFKESEAIQHERESLRSHFRELLRVGKWLVKERTDLIKNFGSKSTTEGSVLLGESNYGTRFSELEHKLVQAEQAWKQLQMTTTSQKSDASGDPLENGNSYHFLRSLGAAQSRCDKNIALSASSSSEEEEEEESCMSGAYSSQKDDNVGDHSIYPFTTNTQADCPVSPGKSSKSTIAPWLLPPNDFLAQLSPFVSQLDLLGRAPTAPPPPFSNQPSNSPDESHDPVNSVRDQSLMSSTSTFYETAHQTKNSSSLEATVLEVIEPSIKGAHLTPDLIRASKCGSTLENDVQWLECPGEPSRLDETIYSEIKGSSCYSSTNAIKSNTLQYSDKLPQPTLHQKKYQFPLTTKCQKQRASSQSPNFNELDDHSVSFSPTTVQNPGSQEKLCEEHLSKSFSNTIQPSNLRTNERLVLTNVDFHPFLSQRTRSSNQLTVLPIIDSSPKMTFPILTSVEFYPQQLETTGSQEEISYGQSSGQVPPESVSTSNTPIMRRSFSSMSRTSSTVLFPSRKGSWVSPEFLSSMVAESTGRFSPSPSEASRTESALAPPPSNASHASHNSEASKTESARGIVPDTRENEEEDPEEFEEDATTRSECECSSSSGDEDIRENPENVPPAHTRTSSNPGERGRKDRKNDEDDENRISSLGTIPSQNSHAAPCISMRPLVSSGIHKATIQRVTKSGRGLSKPWYEIEGSDDEGSLLQKTRSSRSSKLSTSSLSNSQSENETSDEEEHHECPDFV